jgi:hypothetical protein
LSCRLLTGNVRRLRFSNYNCFLLNEADDVSPLRRYFLSNEGKQPSLPIVRAERKVSVVDLLKEGLFAQ